MNIQKKIVFVSAIYPTPIDNGKKVILNGLLSYFVERVGAENIHWVLVGSNQWPEQQNRMTGGVHLHHINSPCVLIKARNVVLRSLIAGDKSIQESLFWSRGLRQDLDKCLKHIHPDLVIYDTIRMGQLQPANAPMRKNILYLEDLFSIRYERILQQIGMGIFLGDGILGNFARFVPSIFHGWINNNPTIQRNILKLEKDRVKRSERSQPLNFSVSLLLNDGEAKVLSQEVEADIRVLSPWVPMNSSCLRKYNGDPSFVFLGALNYAQNEIALLSFLKDGFSEFCRRVPEGKLIIVGKNPTPRILEEVGRWKGRAKLVGYVESLDSLFAQCCGMIVPLVFGSGIKLKVLEALARGVPLVTTDCGVEGIPVVHGRECFIENDLSQYVKWMERLMELTENQTMSLAASKFFQNYYSKECVFKNYDNIFHLE